MLGIYRMPANLTSDKYLTGHNAVSSRTISLLYDPL
jgi:hypothetical protein